ncbi:hypothetical protein GGI43DRAFT_64260 [Trichoderma evansii]
MGPGTTTQLLARFLDTTFGYPVVLLERREITRELTEPSYIHVHVRKATWRAAVVPLHGLQWGRGPIRRVDGVRDRLDSRLSRSGSLGFSPSGTYRWVLPFLGCDVMGMERNSASVVWPDHMRRGTTHQGLHDLLHSHRNRMKLLALECASTCWCERARCAVVALHPSMPGFLFSLGQRSFQMTKSFNRSSSVTDPDWTRPWLLTGSDGGGDGGGVSDVGIMVIMEVDDDNAIGHLAGSQGPGTQATGAKKENKQQKTSKAGKARQQGQAGRQGKQALH